MNVSDPRQPSDKQREQPDSRRQQQGFVNMKQTTRDYTSRCGYKPKTHCHSLAESA
ncbi:hypothetical protein ACQUQU_06315 [Thalassolituus sp. LLYu03]|uniref:hypothetical protein n=1 Tax=Thalassolituus sp. LLYu03 TaxID=3421656 RepID=UPI003D2B9A67